MSSEVRVLHVEDEPDFADLTATFLERTDDRLSVETAHDADAALARLANDIDCIVADYDLPAHTGIELLEAVRADYPDLPFILYTGKGSEAVASEAISAGVTDYLQKGTGTDQYTVLANRITNAVENSRTKAALERSEERYRRLVDEAPVPIVVYEESGAILDANDAALETLDIAASGDGLDVNVFELVHPDTRDRCRRRVQRLIENGETLESIRLEVTTQQGTSRILTGSSTAIRYDGQPAVQTIAYDVTDRERRTAKLQRLHEATRSFIQCESPQAVCDAAVEAATDVLSLPMCTIWLHDEATTTLQPASSTQTARETFGQAPVYEPGNSLSWQVYRTGESVFYSSVGEHEGAYNQETIVGAELIVPLGEHGVINLASTDEGELTELDQSLADIFAANVTAALDRASREQSRKESERRFRALFEQSADPMYIHDDEGEITAVNDRACEVTGYEREALLGMRVSELQAAQDYEELKDRWDTMEAGDIWEGTGRHRRTDGETFPVEVRVSRIESTDGGQFLAIARDITDRQRHQQAVQALHDATRDLFRADDPETVAERVAEACHTALGFQNNVVRLVDDGERLQPVAVSQGAQTVLGDRPTYPVGEGTAGQAFEAGRTLVYDDVQTIDDDYDRGMPGRACTSPSASTER